MRLRTRGTPGSPGSPAPAGHRGSRGRRSAALAALLALALAAPVTALTTPAGADPAPTAAADEVIRQYEIAGPATAAERSALTAIGVSIDEVDARSVVVSANATQLQHLKALGYKAAALPGPPQRNTPGLAARPLDFPSADAKYHNHAEMNAEIDQRLAAYPSLMS
ncbi:zinc carboxypeptidase, partial [Streptomyces sp. NPDC056069]